MMNASIIAVCGLVLLYLAFTVYLVFWRAKTNDLIEHLEGKVDGLLLAKERTRLAALGVLGYLPLSNVDIFYGAENGVQTNFAQRQEVMKKVQAQNEALRTFYEAFGFNAAQVDVAHRRVNPTGKAPWWSPEAQNPNKREEGPLIDLDDAQTPKRSK